MDTAARAYFDALPADRKDRVEALHALVIELFPQAVIDMRYKMPTYTVGEGWVAIANQKNYISLYTCSAAHLEDFKKQHPDIKTGKGCINFRDRDAIPEPAVKVVIKQAIANPKGH